MNLFFQLLSDLDGLLKWFDKTKKTLCNSPAISSDPYVLKEQLAEQKVGKILDGKVLFSVDLSLNTVYQI